MASRLRVATVYGSGPMPRACSRSAILTVVEHKSDSPGFTLDGDTAFGEPQRRQHPPRAKPLMGKAGRRFTSKGMKSAKRKGP